MSYKRADDVDGNGINIKYPTSTKLNGSSLPSYFTATNSMKNHECNEQTGKVRFETAESILSQQATKNPRGGVIGRTPTPPSAPTPIYEKDAR